MSHQLVKCDRCGKTPLKGFVMGFVGGLCLECYRETHPLTRQETLA